jgi:hypothetical protein
MLLRSKITGCPDAAAFVNVCKLKSSQLESIGLSFVGEIEPAKLGAFLNDVAPWLSGHNVIDGGLRRFLRQNAALHGLKMYDSELEQVVLAPRT